MWNFTEVKASSDNKTYTLYGTFDTSVTYTVMVNLKGTTVENTHIYRKRSAYD